MTEFTLNNGARVAGIAFGTGSVHKGVSHGVDSTRANLLRTVIQSGFTHLDAAQVYGTEPDLGAALADFQAQRASLFVATKVGRDLLHPSVALASSLQNLGLGYVDAFMVHEPYLLVNEGGKAALQQCWAAMEECLASGKTKAIGVSNFTVEHLEMIMETAKVTPVFNQVEFSAYAQQPELRAYCAKRNIRMTAYGVLNPLTRNLPGPLDATLDELAAKYGASKESILMAWSLAMGVGVVTTTRQPEKAKTILADVQRVKLSAEDVELISQKGVETTNMTKHSPRLFDYLRLQGMAV